MNAVSVMCAMLRALQIQLRAVDASIGAVLKMADEPVATPPSGGRVTDPATCPHPPQLRQSSRRMGHPNEFYCDMCKSTVDPDKE